MATKTVIDYRRTDERTNVLSNPYWITSAEIYGPDCEDKYAVLFSFPVAGQIILIHEAIVQITTGFTAGTTIDTGIVTLATDDVTSGGVATTVDDDEFVPTANLTIGTAGYYPASTGDFITAAAAATGAGRLITGAATTVPAVAVLIANASTVLAGKARVHMLITRVPGVV